MKLSPLEIAPGRHVEQNLINPETDMERLHTDRQSELPLGMSNYCHDSWYRSGKSDSEVGREFYVDSFRKTSDWEGDVKSMAEESGYDDVKYYGEIDGYKVFIPKMKDGSKVYVGLPSFILVKDGEARWTSDKEGFAFLNKMQKD